MWVPNQENARRDRERYLRRHYSRAKASGALPAKSASWISNELLPVVHDLAAQGYALEDRQTLVEALIAQGMDEQADYLTSLSNDVWQEFLEFGVLGAAMKTAVVSEPLKSAFRELLEYEHLIETLDVETAVSRLDQAVEILTKKWDLEEVETDGLREMIGERWPRLEIAWDTRTGRS